MRIAHLRMKSCRVINPLAFFCSVHAQSVATTSDSVVPTHMIAAHGLGSRRRVGPRNKEMHLVIMHTRRLSGVGMSLRRQWETQYARSCVSLQFQQSLDVGPQTAFQLSELQLLCPESANLLLLLDLVNPSLPLAQQRFFCPLYSFFFFFFFFFFL